MTMTVELPDSLSQRLEEAGISQRALNHLFIRVAEEYLRDVQQTHTNENVISVGRQFARRIIADNRELFEELARV